MREQTTPLEMVRRAVEATSQTELAKRANCSQSSISHILAGKRKRWSHEVLAAAEAIIAEAEAQPAEVASNG